MGWKDNFAKWMAAAQLMTLSPVQPVASPKPDFPERDAAAEVINSVPKWQNLATEGKITFLCKEQPIAHDSEEYQQRLRELGYAIQDVLEDDELGQAFIHAIETQGLKIQIDAYSARYDPDAKVVRLNLLQPDSDAYLSYDSGKAIPMSEHRTVVHELSHYLSHMGGKDMQETLFLTRDEEENLAVAFADRMMSKYGEPPRKSYLGISSRMAEDFPRIRFYRPGQRFADKCDVEKLPMMRECDKTLVLRSAVEVAVSWHYDAGNRAVEHLQKHYEQYLQQHGSEEEREVYAAFKEKGLQAAHQFKELFEVMGPLHDQPDITQQDSARIAQQAQKLEHVSVRFQKRPNGRSNIQAVAAVPGLDILRYEMRNIRIKPESSERQR